MIDVTHEINAVQRTLGDRLLESGEARVVTVARTYPADVEDVWDACTNPERLPRWFLPVTGDLRLGGRYQLEGNAAGTVERCDPPTGLAATWEFDGEVSWIELRLSPAADGGTRFELDHIAHVDDQRWTEFGPGAAGVGWDLALVGLADHLRTGSTVALESTDWGTSADGARFVTLSSEAWRDASIAHGTDADAARAAAERTTAFYTGTPTP